MPIRVEHGPNLAPIGQLAYQTGQLEYRNKRRTELERLAMLQAQMRQKAQQQQNQIAATLQGQKMSHMGAMQRLQQAQQFGQINAEQANQWQVQADVKAQENRVLWGKQMGQNQLDLANMNAGIADQKVVQRVQNAHRQDQAFQNLNPAGEGEWLNIGKQIVAAGNNQKIPPQELDGHIAQLRAQQDALVDQDEMTYGKKNKVGYEAPDMWDADGQVTRIRFVPGVDSTGTPIVKYKQPTSRFTTGPDGNQEEIPLTTQEYAEQGNGSVTINGYVIPTEWDEDLGRMKQVQGVKGEMTDERRAQEEEKDRAEAERERHEKWDFDSEKKRQDVLANYEGPDSHLDEEAPAIVRMALDPVAWRNNFKYPKEPRFDLTETNNPPVPQAQQNQVVPLDDAAPAVPLEQQPVAPVAPQAIGGPVQQPVAPVGEGAMFDSYDPANANQVAGGLAVYPGAKSTGLIGEAGYRTQKKYNTDAGAPVEQPPVAPVAAPAAGGIGGPAPQAPVSKEFEAVPPEYHPRKQWGDTPIKSTPEGYKAMGPVSIYAIAPEDQQAVYQERQREAKILPWDSEERGGVSPGTIANALKNGPLEYGAKVDLSKDNSPFSAKWKEETGSDVLVINDNLMFKLLSPGLTAEQQAELQQRIYTQKKKHFEYYGEPSDFPSDNMNRFQQRIQGIQ